MEGIYGLALLSASILALAFAAKIRNAPNAAKWLKSNAILQTVLFTTIAGLVFAISMMIEFAVTIKSGAFGLVETGLLVAIVAISWVGWRAIKKMPTTAPVAVVGPAENLPPPANTDGPTVRTGRKTARKVA